MRDNCWNEVSIDLEIIQTEGFAATKKVDPHLVTRKKGNEEQELQDGWAGHVLPFNLVQETILKQDLNEIRELESGLADIPGEYETLLDEFGEEDKDAYRECFSEEGDAFVTKEISKKLKELKKDTSPEAQNAYRIFSKVCDLTQDEKTLRTDIKNKTIKLETKTKETIENLSDEQVLKLLEEKWISPLKSELDKLPDVIVDTLVTRIQALQSKYATTFMDIENEIHETEKQLVKMIDELDGSEYDLKGLGELKALLMGD